VTFDVDHIDIVYSVDIDAHGSLFVGVDAPRVAEVQGSAPLFGDDIILGIKGIAASFRVNLAPDDMDMPQRIHRDPRPHRGHIR